MVEDQEPRWRRTAEKETRNHVSHRNSNYGEGDVSRHRHSRRVEARTEDKDRRSSRDSGAAQGAGKQGNQREGLEEGEIWRVVENSQPSVEFQEALRNTEAPGIQVVTDPIEEVKGLALVSDLKELDEEKTEMDMDMDEIRASMLEKGVDIDSEEFMKEVPEANIDEMIREVEEEETEEMEESAVVEGVEEEAVERKETSEDQEEGEGGQERRKGVRRRLARLPSNVMSSNKMRATAGVMLSPRKRNAAKGGTRQGEESKVATGKGALPPLGNNKKT